MRQIESVTGFLLHLAPREYLIDKLRSGGWWPIPWLMNPHSSPFGLCSHYHARRSTGNGAGVVCALENSANRTISKGADDLTNHGIAAEDGS